MYKKAGEIYPSGRTADYLTARKIAKEANASLPPNALHDDILLRSDRWKSLARRGIYPA